MGSLSLEWNLGIAGSFNFRMIQHCSQSGELRAVGNSELKKKKKKKKRTPDSHRSHRDITHAIKL